MGRPGRGSRIDSTRPVKPVDASDYRSGLSKSGKPPACEVVRTRGIDKALERMETYGCSLFTVLSYWNKLPSPNDATFRGSFLVHPVFTEGAPPKYQLEVTENEWVSTTFAPDRICEYAAEIAVARPRS
jgi:hypothetical protein